ncbi:hypothetical protein V1387_00745 [Allomuricauda taeanensis]|uniref:hypothetical protein n=1 Tax=Flagellimonas taeanensis TaxID=1005926 RepID=UPI002E7BCE30|nr:hypothetical protein [Allomuricauda taeanensis]MEE1961190.1 hypothetical protein [Allomuricauda taeanensis]
MSNILPISNTHFSTFGGVNAVCFDPKGFNHNWVINSADSLGSDYSVEIDDIGTALEVIHRFSGVDKESISEGLKSLSTYTETPPIFFTILRP